MICQPRYDFVTRVLVPCFSVQKISRCVLASQMLQKKQTNFVFPSVPTSLKNGVDFIGSFINPEGELKYILNIVDYFSRARFPEVTDAADAKGAIGSITSYLLRAPAQIFR